jgi:NAD+ synthase
VIPENILTKAPSAELKENQTDQDTLPPYAVLDDILSSLVEHEMPLADIVARGHSAETVKRVERMLYLAEYKRRQAAPGVKISSRNFGRDRRYPIVNKFREEVASAAPASTPAAAAPRVAAPRADGGDVS